MPARSYRPSGESDSGAFPVLVGGCLGVGILVGIAEAVVGRFLFSLLILFPLALGFAVGIFAAWRVGKARIRAPTAALLAALVGGLAGQASVHVARYQIFRLEAAAALRASNPGADPDKRIDAYLARETGQPGFRGWLQLQAGGGVSVKRGTSEVSIKGSWAWLLWGVEILLAMGVAGWMALDRARQPFCERCRRWYDVEAMVSAGSPEKRAWQATMQAIERADYPAAAAARGGPTDRAASLLLLKRCSHCEGHDPVLTLKVVTRTNTRKPQSSVKARRLLRPEEARGLLDALEAAKPKEPQPPAA